MTTVRGVRVRQGWGAWIRRWPGPAAVPLAAAAPGPAAAPGAGLTGYRYLLAVVLLVTLTSVPTLVATAAGVATLSEPPAPVVDTTPIVTYTGTSIPGCPRPVGSH
jgi:hypothetical protein